MQMKSLDKKCKRNHDQAIHGYTRWSKRDGYRVNCHACKLIHLSTWRDGNRFSDVYKIKHSSRRFIQYAIETGRLTRTNECKLCYTKGLTDFHHINYDKDPTFKNVIEVCRSCHKILDKDIIPFKVTVCN